MLNDTRRAILLLFFVLAALTSIAEDAAAPPRTFDHSKIETRNGFGKGSASWPSSVTNVLTFFTSADVERTAPWLPSDSSPPLSPHDAIVIAQATAEEWYAGHDDISWKLAKIALVPLNSADGKWYWEATLDVTSGKRSRELEMVIHMDGSVITTANAPGAD
jgi:hypothetical protein